MMGQLIRFSIRYPGVIVGLSLLVIAYGIYQIKQSPLNVFPEFSPTQVIIQTESPGFSSDLVETLISNPIEKAIAGTIGIKQIRSQSIPGLSVVTVIFEEGTDIFKNRQSISEKLSNLSRIMPQDITPLIAPLTSSASSVLGIGITSNQKTNLELRTFAENIIIPHLMGVPGVADVNRFGGEVSQLQIEVIPDKLYKHEVNIEDVIYAVQKATGQVGGGFIENDNQRIIVNSEARIKKISELRKLPIINNKGDIIRVEDIANVSEGKAPSISAVSINEKDGVYLSVQGQLGSNTYKLTKQLEQSLNIIKPLLKQESIELFPDLFKPANFIDASIDRLRFDIIIGAIMVVTILYLFLFNLKTAFISAVAIPISLLSAICVMSFYGLGLNVMVLSGLAIVLGEVVDDAIIDVENIFRRLRQNKLLTKPLPIYQVVFNASMEVRKSVVFATIIIVLVFLPLLSLSGVAGKLFGPLGIAYISSIIASLFVALTVTPALCYLMLGNTIIKSEDSPIIASIKIYYEKIIRAIENKSSGVIIMSFLLISIGLAFLPFFKTQFIPPLHEGHYIMHMTAYPGTSEKESIRIGNLVTNKILKIDGVKSVAQWVGRSPMGADTFGTHYSEFEIELDPLDGPSQDKILDQINSIVHGDIGEDLQGGFVGVNFAINTFLTERIEETISGYNASVVVNVFGSNLDSLDQDIQKIAQVLQGIKGAIDITVQSPPGTPQVKIRLKPEKIAQLGIMNKDVLDAIRVAYEGITATYLYEGIHKKPVVITFEKDYRNDIAKIKNLPIRSNFNKIFMLSDIADITQENGRSKILHENGKRVQTITANISNRDFDTFSDELKQKLSKLNLNTNNYYEITGSAEENAKAREELITHSFLAGTAVLLMLIIAFGSLPNLIITILNLPFALIGGVLAATFYGGWLSIGSLVGFVTLFGITLRNSIMLISHYQHLIENENLPWNLETCVKGAKERLPSILMTALVAGLALLPIAMGTGEPGNEITGPMATIIIGGLFTSTILNLLILPTILLNFGVFKKRVF
tara:strand:+ start:8578 stop:11688 length:3111 start_codon:yes stop_codon:yes gene_type:complete